MDFSTHQRTDVLAGVRRFCVQLLLELGATAIVPAFSSSTLLPSPPLPLHPSHRHPPPPITLSEVNDSARFVPWISVEPTEFGALTGYTRSMPCGPEW